MLGGAVPPPAIAPGADAPFFLIAFQGMFQTSQLGKDAQPTQVKGRLAALGERVTNQIGIRAQDGSAWVIRR